MATIGILICISAHDEDGENRIGIEAVDVTPEQALEHVRRDELHNIGFDRSTAGPGEIGHYDALAVEVDKLAWPAAANENGQFVIASPWAGGLDEDGMEWRYAPVLDIAA